MENRNLHSLITIYSVCGFFGAEAQKQILLKHSKGKTGYTIDIGLILINAYEMGIIKIQ